MTNSMVALLLLMKLCNTIVFISAISLKIGNYVSSEIPAIISTTMDIIKTAFLQILCVNVRIIFRLIKLIHLVCDRRLYIKHLRMVVNILLGRCKRISVKVFHPKTVCKGHTCMVMSVFRGLCLLYMIEIQLLIQKALISLISISQILSMLNLGLRHYSHFICIIKLRLMMTSHALRLAHVRAH